MSETTTETRKWIDVGASGEIADGEVKTFQVEGHRVAVARANGQLYAVQDLCTHDDGPLGEGDLEGFAIICPRHGARFDIRSGAVLAMPAVAPIETFPIMEKDDRIQVAVKDTGSDETDDW
jgi:3-phenylpropionate/trans-cinnamate dioxygenase ferredoxin subunit